MLAKWWTFCHNIGKLSRFMCDLKFHIHLLRSKTKDTHNITGASQQKSHPTEKWVATERMTNAQNLLPLK